MATAADVYAGRATTGVASNGATVSRDPVTGNISVTNQFGATTVTDPSGRQMGNLSGIGKAIGDRISPVVWFRRRRRDAVFAGVTLAWISPDPPTSQIWRQAALILAGGGVLTGLLSGLFGGGNSGNGGGGSSGSRGGGSSGSRGGPAGADRDHAGNG